MLMDYSFKTDCVFTYKKGLESSDGKEKRENFQKILKNKLGLTIKEEPATSETDGYIRIQTPFDILLLTAGNIRMKLPIEKIEKPEADSISEEKKASRWQKFKEWIRKPFDLDPLVLKKNEIDYYTAPYSRNNDNFAELFDTLRGSKDNYFTPNERTLLTYELLSRATLDHHPVEESNGGKKESPVVFKEGQGIDGLISDGSLQSYFPLHESLRYNFETMDINKLNNREKLTRYWATLRLFYKFQPLDQIRSYMGEQVAFYFAVSGFYTKMLIPAAIVGVLVFFYGIGSIWLDPIVSDICGDFGETTYMCPVVCDRICLFEKLSKSCAYSKVSAVFDNPTTVIFAGLMSLWTRWFIEMWKRREAELQFEWDSIDFVEHNEPIRPDYAKKAKDKKSVNPVTMLLEPYVKVQKRYYLASVSFITLMIAIACVHFFTTIVFRIKITDMLNNTTVKAYSSIIVTISSALINLIVSVILSKLYYWLTRKLTEYESHKYQSQYDNSFTIKIYLFEFVNSYSSIFYIAFLKGRFRYYPSIYGEVNTRSYSEQCDPTGCLVELSIQLFIIMTGKQVIKLLSQLIGAKFRNIFKKCKPCYKKKSSQSPIPQPPQQQWEIDSELQNFESTTLLKEYLNIVIQFGFVTLFVTAFPLAPLFALINNLIELRLDAWKLSSKFKRPVPFKAANIGVWNHILSGVSHLALLTNAVIIAWTSEFIPKMSYRLTQTDGRSVVRYINWTLSSFPIAEYNLTNILGSNVPVNVTYCRYRDFRESTGPSYNTTILYWNVLAARLAFIIVFEHLVFCIVYLIQWFIPDVPKEVQEKIKRERFLDQNGRWSSKKTQDQLKNVVTESSK